MMQDFNQGEISSTSSIEDANESLIRDRSHTAANPDWRQEQEKIKKTYLKMDDAGRISKAKKRKKKKKYSSSSSTSSSSSSLSSDSSSSVNSRRSSRRRKIKKTRALKYLG